MEGIVHILAIHGLDKEAHGGDHDNGVAGLDADDDIVEMLALTDAQELHAALDNALGGVAIARHDAIGQGAVVDTDADGGVVLLADVEEGHELGFYLLQLGSILGIGVFEVLEGAPGIDIVARIDAYLLAILGCDIGDMGGEMDIGNKGGGIAVGLEACGDVLHIFCLAGALGGEAHEFATGIDDALGLCHTALGVVGIDSGHGLDADGVVASDGDIAYVGDTANSSCTHNVRQLILCLP